MSAIAERMEEQTQRANASGKRAVVFIHGLWLLPSSWDSWAELFEAAGFAAVEARWPDDPASVEEARSHANALAGKKVGQIAQHLEGTIRGLSTKPVIVGHSFGGLFTQIVAGRGLGAASVAIDPAPFRGVLPLPFSALKSAWPVLRNPSNRGRAVMLTFEQFRYGWGNALAETEAKRLYETYSVPGPGSPVFQAAAANLNPWTEVKVEIGNPERGPLLVISGEKDHTVPPVIAHASYQRQKRNPGVTEFKSMANRGHSLTIDSGWHEVAEVALAFLKRFV